MFLQLKGLKKIYEEEKGLKNLDLEIEEGSFVTLLGPSGCGKTTTLNLLGGFIQPDSGHILLEGEDITGLPPERRPVSTVFQSYALFPHLNVLDNVCYGLRFFRGMKKKEAAPIAMEELKTVGLSGYETARIGELSGGQQQRVALARAMATGPKILLLDEPLSNLDARLRLQTREEIRRIQKATGITTVFVTHDQEEAMSISDLIVVMKDGVVQQIGKPQAVYDFPVNLFVAKFLGTPPINVFDGEVKGGQLYIGGEAVLTVPGVADQSVTAAIRPEGFILSETGALSCDLSRVEVMGRDVSVVSTHPKSRNVTIRSIISAENAVNTASQKVRFDLKPNKVFLFHKETGARIDFG